MIKRRSRPFFPFECSVSREDKISPACLFQKFLFAAFLCTETPATIPILSFFAPLFFVLRIKYGVLMVLYPVAWNSRPDNRAFLKTAILKNSYTVSFLLPFARRRERTRRPVGELRRARNPWVRFLFFFFGLYVNDISRMIARNRGSCQSLNLCRKNDMHKPCTKGIYLTLPLVRRMTNNKLNLDYGSR